MSIPLDNLYHWVDSLMPGPANLYVFRPHGSKKISDLSWLNDYDKKISYKFPSIIMHDQEPLDWDFYDCPDQYMELFHLKKWEISAVNNLRINYFSTFNLKFLTLLNGVIYDQDILIHSEKVVDNFPRKLQHMIQMQDLRLELHRLQLELRSQDPLLLLP
jgi:hypothetical protein